MYFGATTFAEDCFGAQGVPNTIVEVSGIALSMNAGSSAQTGDANVSLTGTALTSSIGTLGIQIDVSFALSGIGMTASQGIANGIGWATVSTGTAQTYSAVSTGSSQTWTAVSKGTEQTWTIVDEVEKVA
tara:strand:- start:262 stop:651 length:390 start_codon:yes stop_codon:yes gene_type:complete